MLNGVNINDNLGGSQLDGVSGVVTNPIKNPYGNVNSGLLIDETSISSTAMQLYQHDQDVQQFNTLAMSDPEDLSHEEIIANLFNKGVSDPSSDETVSSLAGNQRLLEDLGL